MVNHRAMTMISSKPFLQKQWIKHRWQMNPRSVRVNRGPVLSCKGSFGMKQIKVRRHLHCLSLSLSMRCALFDFSRSASGEHHLARSVVFFDLCCLSMNSLYWMWSVCFRQDLCRCTAQYHWTELGSTSVSVASQAVRSFAFLIKSRRKQRRWRARREREKEREEGEKKKYVCHQESHFMRRFSRAYSSSLFVSLEQSTLRENGPTNERTSEGRKDISMRKSSKDRSDCRL